MNINWSKPSDKISEYFRVVEVTQGDRRRIPQKGSDVEKNILYLARKLDVLRNDWGSPIGVTSWYRPYAINLAVGGVTNSQHITGGAADVFNYEGNDRDFELWLDDVWGDRALGFGVLAGRGFTHLDLRLGGLRWNY